MRERSLGRSATLTSQYRGQFPKMMINDHEAMNEGELWVNMFGNLEDEE